MLSKNKIFEIWNKFSEREKVLAFAGCLIVVFLILNSLAEPLLAKRVEQLKQLKSHRDNLALLPNQLEKYTTLYHRQERIEQEFQQVSFREGVLSHLEDLIRNKAKIDTPTNYKINPLPERPFSKGYRREPFRVELNITSEEDLKSFLQELVAGPRPLVLTRLEVKKSPNQTKLTVQLDISNFQKI